MLTGIAAQLGQSFLAECLALALGLAGIGCARGGTLPLHLEAPTLSSDPIRVEGAALEKCDVEHHLKVFVAPSSGQSSSSEPLFGSVVRDGSAVLFVPAFPVRSGVTYRVAVNCAGSGDESPTWFREFTVPEAGAVREVPVVEISPSATELPANTLRFYLSFNADMRGRFSRRDISLRDDTGHERKLVFMSFGQELWSADGRRLTLLIDPGRLKRGVTANVLEGPPLEPGRRYVLSIHDRESAGTQPMLTAAGFLVVEAERRPLDPRAWRLAPPRSAGRDAMSLVFDRVMDQGLLRDSVRVIDPEGHSVAGTIQSSPGGRSLRFLPDDQWRAGGYYVEFAPHLEDVCGNRIGEALDHEVGSNDIAASTRLAFTIQ